jgi:epoxyqueuosine reductase
MPGIERIRQTEGMPSVTDDIKRRAADLGFDLAGITPAEPLTREGELLAEWLARGYHATMRWMERNRDRRTDPRTIVEGARSVISLGMNYYTPHGISDVPERGKISRYAWGDDYHDILGERLRSLWAYIREIAPEAEGRYYVDTGPVMDKVWAARAGIGWIGKHTNVISREFGSWIFLGEIITTLELEYDVPGQDHCGSCRRCIDACPTGAIVDEYIVDSGKCLSYITIEHRDDYPAELKPHTEHWIYGCDICQDVCPWNLKFSRPSAVEAFEPRPENLEPLLNDIVEMTREEFSRRFRKSPVKRTKLHGLQRNARAVIEGNIERKTKRMENNDGKR